MQLFTKNQKPLVVFLTGGSSGIGLATAKLLINSGICVYAASRKGGIGEKSKNGGELISVQMDVNNSTEIQEVINKIIIEKGYLDVVICNAGNGISGAVEDTTIEEAEYQFRTNFFGMQQTVLACLPVFRRQGYGRIITISSVAAIISIPFQAFYSASKAAVLAYTKALQMEVRPFNIQCCCILPGDTQTEFTKSRIRTKKSEQVDSPYFQAAQKAVGKMEQDERNGMNPNIVAKVIVRQIGARKMRPVVIPHFNYKLFGFLVRILPNKTILNLVGGLYS